MQNVLVFEPHHDDALASAANILFSDRISTTVITVTDADDDRSYFDFTKFKCSDIRKPLNVSSHTKLYFRDLHWQERKLYTENMLYHEALLMYIKMYGAEMYKRLVTRITAILSENKSSLAAFPLGIRHPMHMLVTGAAIEAIQKTGFDKGSICFYYDQPYDLLEHDSDRIFKVREFVAEKIGVQTEVYNDCEIDGSQLGKAVELAYGKLHFAEFGGTLAKTVRTDYLPCGENNAFVPLLKLHRNNILMIASQAFPYFATGGSGFAICGLSRSLSRYVNSVAVLVPKHPNRCLGVGHMGNFTFDYPESDGSVYKAVVHKHMIKNVLYYLADVVDYTKISKDSACEYEASAIFCDAVLQGVLDAIDFEPSVLHCHDWQTGLIPFLKKVKYYGRSIPHCIFTIHGFGYKGICEKSIIYGLTGLDGTKCNACLTCSFEHCHLRNISYLPWQDSEKLGVYNDYMSFLTAGMKYAERVTTTSRGYASEISSYSEMQGINVKGIRNGIESVGRKFPTAKGYLLPTEDDFKNVKAENKTRLCKELGFSYYRPLVCIVSRLSPEKGINQILYAMDELVKRDIQLVVCGDESTREKTITAALKEAVEKYPGNIRYLPFEKELEYEIYAASDMILIPSLNETCGTTQMIAMNLGAVPVLTMLSAFKDTVTGYDEEENMEKGIGFYFFRDNHWSMLEALDKALEVYENSFRWDSIVEKNIVTDFGWDSYSLREYIDLYNEL